MKKLGLFAFGCLTAIALASCSKDEIKISPDKEHYVVGICQLATHPALDAATNGFKEELTSFLEQKGRTVEFDLQNAAGESSTCTTINNKFVSHNVDMILANATAPLLSAVNSTLSIPILGTSITDYGSALNVKLNDGCVGGNVSGTSDLAPLDTQASLIHSLFPEATKVGILYCSSESNSKFQLDTISQHLDGLGLQTEGFPFVDSNDLATVTNRACSYSDVLYLPTDNTVASNAGLIDTIARPLKTPIFAGEEGVLKKCGCFSLTISYENLGKVTGTMAGKILTGEIKISETPIAYDTEPKKVYNPVICTELGVNVPDDFTAVELD